MRLPVNMSVERTLRTVHGWLGVFILPWVILAGLTGFYLNHAKAIDAYLPQAGSFNAALFDKARKPEPATPDSARAVAARVWPGDTFKLERSDDYRGRHVFFLSGAHGAVIVDKESGFYWVRTAFQRRVYAPDGALLHRQVRWGAFFKTLHTRGWPGNLWGKWLADATAIALIVFGTSGLVLFFAPRLRRARNRRSRRAEHYSGTLQAATNRA